MKKDRQWVITTLDGAPVLRGLSFADALEISAGAIAEGARVKIRTERKEDTEWERKDSGSLN